MFERRRGLARFGALLRREAQSLRQGLLALLASSGGDLLAGLTLGAITGTLERLPGLLVLVPAAIGMRGNIFGALGSRLGTQIHTGTFRLARRADTDTGQSVLASMALTLWLSVALAVLAKAVATTFNLSQSISVVDFLVISVVGGVASSVVVLGVTVAVAAVSVRRGWDMDNVSAPLVTAAGDIATLPSLYLATYLIGIHVVSPMVAVVASLGSVVVLVAAVRQHGLPLLRRIVVESFPVLLLAGTIDVVAGMTIEKRLQSFLEFPALLVLVPPFLEDAGALGSLLSARIASKLHLGLIGPQRVPSTLARQDFALTYLFAVPVFTLVALSAQIVSIVFDLGSPGPVPMVLVALLGGFFATTGAVLVAYYGAIGAVRLGLDPDNHGVPLVTSSMDLVGSMALILAIVVVGVG